MYYGIYHVFVKLLDNAILPPYKGSTFRGAFGKCLKKAVCTTRKKECADCLLVSHCLYARFFENKEWEHVPSPRTAAPPHPYVLEPPESTQTHYPAGEALDFRILLFGEEMQRALPYFVCAFELMGEQGIGKTINARRARFCLTNVTTQGVGLYDPATRRLAPSPAPLSLTLHPTTPTDTIHTITLHFRTPLRLKQDNRLQASLPFSVLVRALLRRVSTLFNAWGDGEPQLDYRGMVARAEQVQVADNQLHWHEWTRYSHRQDQAMQFGGLMGSITYTGPLEEYLPLIRLGERLHIGKQTTFGLGRFVLAAP